VHGISGVFPLMDFEKVKMGEKYVFAALHQS
jgi:hypothetical protein